MCCGKKRNEISKNSLLSTHQNSINTTKEILVGVDFQYIGETGLTVTGSVTGKRYRFSKTAEVQLIDYRDAGAIRSVPVLKRIDET